jgi:hypothetical protein
VGLTSLLRSQPSASLTRRVGRSTRTTKQGATPPRDLGAKGTVARPLDGGALSLAGNAHAGEWSNGGATTLRCGHSVDFASTSLGKWRRG